MYVRRSPEKVMLFPHGRAQWLLVFEDPHLEPGQARIANDVLYIGRETDVDELVFCLNLTSADVRFLKSIHIAESW